MEQVWTLFGEFLMQIFIALATIALGIGINWMRKNTTLQQRRLMEVIVAEGIKYAQETYGHLPGNVRFEKASEAIVAELDKFGIKMTTEQLQVHIQAILKELKKEFGEQWKEQENFIEYSLVEHGQQEPEI